MQRMQGELPPVIIEQEESKETLPFNEHKQDAILGHLLLNDKFFVQCSSRIIPEWFLEDSNQIIYKIKLDFYKKFKRCPSLDEVKNNEVIMSEDSKTRARLIGKIDILKFRTTTFGLDALIPELTNWLHARAFHKSLYKSRSLYNADKFQEAFATVKAMVKEVDETAFHQDSEVRFDNYEEFYKKKVGQYDNALTFGNDHVDKLLDPDSYNGALLRGDTTVLISSVNTGKSLCEISIARHNILRGRAVLWITHEGTVLDLQTKMWCCMLDISKGELLSRLQDTKHFPKFDEMVKWFNDYLTFIPMNKAGLTVEEVESVIRKRQEERVSKYGEGYALLVNDYPAKLTTQAAKGGQLQHRNIIENVYNHFVQLALEYNFHSLLAIQTNRDGSKINSNEKGHDKRLLRMEDVAEAFGVPMVATNVITINRDPLAQMNNIVTFHICKSRSNEKNLSIVCRSNFGHATTHNNEMGSTWYRSGATMSGKVDDLLKQYKNEEIPRHLLVE